MITKQVMGIKVLADVTEYRAEVYLNPAAGKRIHAAFPKGTRDDVNYDGSIKVSKGMISSLGNTFAIRTEQERKEVFKKIIASPVMHTDFTAARANAKTHQVAVCAVPGGYTLYFARKQKGIEGIRETAVEDYCGILVYDHDRSFYHYGSNHQECLSHVLRYLKGSMENEVDRTWHKRMHGLIREMIHYKNSLGKREETNDEKVKIYERRYQEIIDKAKEEYEDVPPSDYCRDGYNLYRKMAEYKENHLLFLHDARVPHTNNLAERKCER